MQDHISKCIFRIMKTRGITQGQLASSLSCSQTAISNLLSGKARLTIDDLSKIANTLEVSFDELIMEATQTSRHPIHLNPEVEAYICSNALTFYLLNRLKKPIPIRELLVEFPESEKDEVQNEISYLKKIDLITEDVSGFLKVNSSQSNVLHYRLTKEYSKRISEIYSSLRPIVNEIASSPKKTTEWIQRNVDAFYIEVFTEEQISQQNMMLRQFLDLIKHQIRMNEHSAQRSSLKENSELRVIFTVSAPYPQKKDSGDSSA